VINLSDSDSDNFLTTELSLIKTLKFSQSHSYLYIWKVWEEVTKAVTIPILHLKSLNTLGFYRLEDVIRMNLQLADMSANYIT